MAVTVIPQRKFVVFVSSVTSEFGALRQQLWESIYKAGHIPVVLEKLAGAPLDVRDYIRNEVAHADIVVFVLGHDYGSGLDETQSSFIDDEITKAVDLQLPIIFLQADYDQSPQPEGAKQEKIEQMFQALRAKAQGCPTSKVIHFNAKKANKDHYGELRQNFTNVLRDLATSLKTGGWVNGLFFDRASEQISLAHTVSRNPFFKRFVERMNSFHTLSRRTESYREQKQAMAQFFWERFLARMPKRRVKRLFFESGSTIAYLSYEFVERMKIPWVRQWIANNDVSIHTNNILTYLDFVLADPYADPVDCHLRPPPPADTYYGATFGRAVTSLIELWPPMSRRKLGTEAQEAVTEVSEALQLGSDTVVFMTASGMELKAKHRGPHVGSYYNMLMKRALLTSSSPTVLVLEEAKIVNEFHPGRCFAVCDQAASWDKVCKGKPLAIMTCARKGNAKRYLRELSRLGLAPRIIGEPLEPSAPLEPTEQYHINPPPDDLTFILAANGRFAERFQLAK